MSFKFYSVEFLGTYSHIQSFFCDRGWNYEIKNVGGNKLFLKISEESIEELNYCVGMTFDDPHSGKITGMKEISENEFQNFSENGFEIIHDHHHENKLAKDQNLNNNVGIKIEENVRRDLPKSHKTESQVLSQEETKEEISQRIAAALNDTILPSKSPLPENDLFVYLTSPSYLRNFFIASTLIIFVLALLD